jgi:hypothetical protein
MMRISNVVRAAEDRDYWTMSTFVVFPSPPRAK